MPIFPPFHLPLLTSQGGTGVSVADVTNSIYAQTLNANGAVTFDASLGNIQIVTLNANATSSSIINPPAGYQLLTIMWVQGTGGTFVWPTNCIFNIYNGFSFASPNPYGPTIETFWYDGTNWQQVSNQANFSA